MNLIDYLNKSHSQYQVVGTVIEVLKSNGYKKTNLQELERLECGRYYMPLYDTGLFAFNIPTNRSGRMHIATAHTDFPCFKIKPVPDMSPIAGLNRLNIEPYGGMIKRSWFDRPLGVAGAVWIKGDNEFQPEMKLVDINEPIFLIPSLAPHLDRELEKRAIDPAKELVPIYGLENEDITLADIIAAHVGCDKEAILSYDLNLFCVDKHREAGVFKEFIVGQGLDNIVSVAGLTEAIINSDSKVFGVGDMADDNHISMICLFDNEEIGSRTKQGADNTLIMTIAEKLGIDYENSFAISVDGAHAVHPNYPDKSDMTSKVIMGKGLAIKTSASQRYATDGKMTAIIKSICEHNDIEYQLQANKSGAPGGSTLGPILSAYLPIRSADIGIPMLAMHSINEMVAKADYSSLCHFLEEVI